MDKLGCDLSNDRCQDVWWSEVVNGLSERDEDKSNLKLVVGEVSIRERYR